MRMHLIGGAALAFTLAACGGPIQEEGSTDSDSASPLSESPTENEYAKGFSALTAEGPGPRIVQGTPWSRDFGRLGRIALVAQSRIDPPDFARGDTSGEISGQMALTHTLSNGFVITPATIEVAGSSVNIFPLRAGTLRLGELRMDFSGLMLKGLPQYIEKTPALAALRAQGFVFKRDPGDNSHGTLTKDIMVSVPQSLVAAVAPIEAEIARLAPRIEQVSRSSYITNSQSAVDLAQRSLEEQIRRDPQASVKLKEVQDMKRRFDEFPSIDNEEALKKAQGELDALVEQNSLLRLARSRVERAQNALRLAKVEMGLPALEARHTQAMQRRADLLRELTAEFPCLPKFKRTVTFPIYELGVEAGGGSASARAKFGVHGDVVVSVTPRCGVKLGSGMMLDTYATVDIEILSHGFFGARADAQASGTFKLLAQFDGEYGQYPVDLGYISEQEKEILNNIVLSSQLQAKDVEGINRAILNTLESGIVENAHNLLLGDLIGAPGSPNVGKICRLFQKVGVASGSDMDLICRWAGANPPTLPPFIRPPFVAPPLPDAPVKPSVICEADLPTPPCRKVTTSVDCPPFTPSWLCPEDITTWIPPGCEVAVEGVEAANRLRREACKQLERFEDEVEKHRKEVNRIMARARDEHERNVRRLERGHQRLEQQIERIKRAQNPDFIYRIARSWAESNIFVAKANEKVTKLLLDKIWQVDKYGRFIPEKVDMVSSFIHDNFLSDITVSVAGSARIAFQATAHIVKVEPSLHHETSIVALDGGGTGLESTVSFFRHSNPTEKGRVGGLSILDMTLHADLTATIGNTTLAEDHRAFTIPGVPQIQGFAIDYKRDWNKEFVINLGNARWLQGE